MCILYADTQYYIHTVSINKFISRLEGIIYECPLETLISWNIYSPSFKAHKMYVEDSATTTHSFIPNTTSQYNIFTVTSI